MTTESQELLENNPRVTLNEYVWTRAKGLLKDLGWLRDPNTIPTSVALESELEQALLETRQALTAKLAMSDEQHRKAYDALCGHRQAIFARAESLLAEVTAQMDVEGVRVVRDSAEEELRELIEAHQPTKVTFEQYKLRAIRGAVECAEKAEQVYRYHLNASQEINNGLTTLRKLLGDPPPFVPTAKE